MNTGLFYPMWILYVVSVSFVVKIIGYFGIAIATLQTLSSLVKEGLRAFQEKQIIYIFTSLPRTFVLKKLKKNVAGDIQ